MTPLREPIPPDEAMQQGMRLVWALYGPAYDDLNAEIRRDFADHPEFGPLIASTPPEPDREAERALRGALENGDWHGYWEHTRSQAVGYAHAGISFTAWFELVNWLRCRITVEALQTFSGEDVERAVLALGRWLDDAMGVFGQAFVSANEQVIARQQQAIRQLSTPVLQVRPGMIILPIVGILDRERLDQLREGMLEGVRRRRARVVVLDVTGVPEIDSMVANGVIGAVGAARMMGAEVIVSGLSAEIAQTLVTVGVDLREITSVGDLESGIELASRMLGDGERAALRAPRRAVTS